MLGNKGPACYRLEMENRFISIAPAYDPDRKWAFPVDEEALRYIESVEKLKAIQDEWEATLPWWDRYWWFDLPRIKLVGWWRRLLRLE